MRRMTRAAAEMAAVLLFCWLTPASAAPEKGRFARAFVIEVDGVRRSEHAAQQPLPPASLTKMMSGLLVIESGLGNRPVVISRHAAAATGSRLGLRAGEQMLANDLLSAMLMASSNDACRALAEWVAGSEAAFVDRMNKRAGQLGMKKTRFANACGHDADGHFSTADDLARLARAAMALPDYARRAQTEKIELAIIGGQRRFAISNHNRLIGRFVGATGVKSGFTAKAGKCVVAMAERNGHHVLLVMLNAPNRWWDADAALDYALSRAAETAS